MSDVYTVIADVEWLDEDDIKIKKTKHLLYAGSYAQAAQMIEECYGAALESLTMKLYDLGLIELDDNMQVKIDD
jgi:hypothetical protein